MKTGYVKLGIFSMLVLVATFGLNPILTANAASMQRKDVSPILPAMPTPTVSAPLPTSEPSTDVKHTLIPVAGSGKEQVIYDQVDTATATQKRAYGGEQYGVGKFERPFDKDMNYLAYLDIVKSTMQRNDPNFIYVTVQVAAPLSTGEGKPAFYGLELDTNMDGRSEYLILAEKPQSTEWSVNGVNVWKSSSALASNPPKGPAIPVTGSLGYDVSMFSSGKGDDADLAWVRLSPDKKDTVEIAFKNLLIGGEKGKFVWRPMTDGAPYPTKMYDLNISYTLEQAGSPLKDSMFYPLKEVFAVDNTCRVASGYEASGKESGICPLPPPPSKPSSPQQQQPGNPNTQIPVPK